MTKNVCVCVRVCVCVCVFVCVRESKRHRVKRELELCWFCVILCERAAMIMYNNRACAYCRV